MLHVSTRHTLRQEQAEAAQEMVERCQCGARSILQYMSEANSDPKLRTFSAVTSQIDEVIDQWDKAKVGCHGINTGSYSKYFPEALLDSSKGSFVTDKASCSPLGGHNRRYLLCKTTPSLVFSFFH